MSVEQSSPQYRCGVCGRLLCLEEARLLVACRSCGSVADPVTIEVRKATGDDEPAVREISLRFWGETEVACYDRTFDIMEGSNWLALIDREVAGFISLAPMGQDMVIVLLNVEPHHQGKGIGSALLTVAVQEAQTAGSASLLLTTSNDDLPALYLYQKFGFQLYQVVPDVIAAHHGEVLAGFACLPVRDELRLRLSL
jgi:GNAT superfamily N-acetyltransferase